MCNRLKFIAKLTTLIAAGALPSLAQSVELMPDFSTIPTGWTTSRYEPHSFSNVGSVFGRDNVLGIEISAAEGSDNRPPGFQSTFYGTQGRQYSVTGNSGSTLSADLYLPASWASEDNGTINTGMWGIMTNGSPASDFPIISFTNIDDDPRFRVWDPDDEGWTDVLSAIDFDRWSSLSIRFTGTSYEYSIDGEVVYEDPTTNDSVAFSGLIMEAYNAFGDPRSNPVAYTAYWDNAAPVPVPGAVWLMGSALFGLTWFRRGQQSDTI